MKIKANALALLFTALLGQEVRSDESGSYYGVSVAHLNWSNPIVENDINLHALMLTGGEQYNEYLSAEFRLGAGLNTKSVDVNPQVVPDAQIDIGIKYLFDFSFRLGLPLKYFYPYAALGYGKTELEVTNLANAGEYSESDVTYGVGLDIPIFSQVKLNIEYSNYFNVNSSELSGVHAGLNFRF